MFRKRPIPKSRLYPEASLRYKTSVCGAFRIYPDGREVCFDSYAGRKEYDRRVKLMLSRQNGPLLPLREALAPQRCHFRTSAP